jgi:DNA-binding transcriptional regulator YhcF (GntR family)
MYVPSGAELAKETGFAVLTCRRGLQPLLREGLVLSACSDPR